MSIHKAQEQQQHQDPDRETEPVGESLEYQERAGLDKTETNSADAPMGASDDLPQSPQQRLSLQLSDLPDTSPQGKLTAQLKSSLREKDPQQQLIARLKESHVPGPQEIIARKLSNNKNQ